MKLNNIWRITHLATYECNTLWNWTPEWRWETRERQDSLVVLRGVVDVGLWPQASCTPLSAVNAMAVILWTGQRSRTHVNNNAEHNHSTFYLKIKNFLHRWPHWKSPMIVIIVFWSVSMFSLLNMGLNFVFSSETHIEGPWFCCPKTMTIIINTKRKSVLPLISCLKKIEEERVGVRNAFCQS